MSRFIYTDAEWINLDNVFRIFQRPDGRYTVAYEVAGEICYTTTDDDPTESLAPAVIPALPGYAVVSINRFEPPHHLDPPSPVIAWRFAYSCMRPICLDLLPPRYAVQTPDGKLIDDGGFQYDSAGHYRLEEVARIARSAANNARREAIEAEKAKSAAGAGEK